MICPYCRRELTQQEIDDWGGPDDMCGDCRELWDSDQAFYSDEDDDEE